MFIWCSAPVAMDNEQPVPLGPFSCLASNTTPEPTLEISPNKAATRIFLTIATCLQYTPHLLVTSKIIAPIDKTTMM